MAANTHHFLKQGNEERLFTDWREVEQKSSFPESHLYQHQLPERIAVNDASVRPFQADGPPDVFSARRSNARTLLGVRATRRSRTAFAVRDGNSAQERRPAGGGAADAKER